MSIFEEFRYYVVFVELEWLNNIPSFSKLSIVTLISPVGLTLDINDFLIGIEAFWDKIISIYYFVDTDIVWFYDTSFLICCSFPNYIASLLLLILFSEIMHISKENSNTCHSSNFIINSKIYLLLPFSTDFTFRNISLSESDTFP